MSLFKNQTRLAMAYTNEVGDKIYPVIVDIKRGIKSTEEIQFMSSDINTGILSVAFVLDNADYNVSGTEVVCTVQRPDATILEIPCRHISNNIVEVYLGVNGTSQGGTHTFDFKAYKGGDKVVGTPKLSYTVSQSISSDNSIEEDDRLPILNNLIIQVNNAIENIPSKEELKGEKGDKGEQGVNGITPNISIGNVTTLEPNQQATVTRRGTDTNPIFDFGIPKGEKGDAGSGGSSQIIFDYTYREGQVIQPTSLDFATGIFTCDSVSFTKDCTIKLHEFNMNYVPKELGIHNQMMYLDKLSDTTFKIRLGSGDVTYEQDDSVDVSKFSFIPAPNKLISITDFGELEDGVYRIYMTGTRGRGGQTIINLISSGGKHLISRRDFADGKPIMLMGVDAIVNINKDLYSMYTTCWTAYNNISGSIKGFSYGVGDVSRDFTYSNERINSIQFQGAFADGFRIIMVKEC